MPTKQELHSQLDARSAKLTEARAKMEFRHGHNDGYNLKSGELLVRHRYLEETLDGKAATAETQGYGVSARERDTMAWINSINLHMA